jgi:hypothetical protein
MTGTLEGRQLVIRLKLSKPHPSASGKTIVIASTKGPKPIGLKIRGQVVYIIVNAFYYPHIEPQRAKGPRS